MWAHPEVITNPPATSDFQSVFASILTSQPSLIFSASVTRRLSVPVSSPSSSATSAFAWHGHPPPLLIFPQRVCVFSLLSFSVLTACRLFFLGGAINRMRLCQVCTVEMITMWWRHDCGPELHCFYFSFFFSLTLLFRSDVQLSDCCQAAFDYIRKEEESWGKERRLNVTHLFP